MDISKGLPPVNLPVGKSVEQVMRVVMDEKQLHKLLDPIISEVNALRKRVATLEKLLEDDGK